MSAMSARMGSGLGVLHLMTLAVAECGRGGVVRGCECGLAVKEVNGWPGKDGEGCRWQKVGEGGSEGCVCGLSASEEVTPCQEVSGFWHVVGGGSEEEVAEGTGGRWPTTGSSRGREAWAVD